MLHAYIYILVFPEALYRPRSFSSVSICERASRVKQQEHGAHHKWVSREKTRVSMSKRKICIYMYIYIYGWGCREWHRLSFVLCGPLLAHTSGQYIWVEETNYVVELHRKLSAEHGLLRVMFCIFWYIVIVVNLNKHLMFIQCTKV